MQVVADQDHRHAGLAAQGLDQPVELGDAGLVEALRRLVEDQDIGRGQKRAREKHALELAARELGDLAFLEPRRPHAAQRTDLVVARALVGQGEESFDRDRHRPVDGELLRHVTDPEAGLAPHRSGRRFECADQDPDQRRLARAVGTDDRDDLARLDGEIHVAERGEARVARRHVPRLDQRGHAAAQAGQSPTTSTLTRRTVKPMSSAAASVARRMPVPGASATDAQSSQMKKAGECASPGLAQAV